MSTVVIWGVMFFLGCQSNVDRRELTGIYIAAYPYGIEQLVLKADGTYQQLFSYTDKDMISLNHGKWELRDLEGQSVVLHDPIIIDDGFGQPTAMKKERAIRPLRIKKGFFGTIRLPVNEDRGYEFRRVAWER